MVLVEIFPSSTSALFWVASIPCALCFPSERITRKRDVAPFFPMWAILRIWTTGTKEGSWLSSSEAFAICKSAPSVNGVVMML